MVKAVLLSAALIVAATFGVLGARQSDNIVPQVPVAAQSLPQILEEMPMVDYTFEFPLQHGERNAVDAWPAPATGDGSAGE